MTSPHTISKLREREGLDFSAACRVVWDAVSRARKSDDSIWIHRLSDAEIDSHLSRLAKLKPDEHALYGVPFAIKDNIDLAGIPSTAGCTKFSYTPSQSALVVQLLLDAGAIPIGKTNMDQFATGLTGTRSPYGVVPNAMDSAYISGGSSSGSAVAVATGIVPFALGTDTAGSGRVPAAFNGLVGFKPSRGCWSTRGVVPACRSLDCVSVFTHTVSDAATISRIVGQFDAKEPLSRRIETAGFSSMPPRFGHFGAQDLTWIEMSGYRELYEQFITTLPSESKPIDPDLFIQVGQMLYEGPWLAERVVALGDFLSTRADAIHPVTRSVIEKGKEISAADYFRAHYKLAELRREIESITVDIDVLIAPTCLQPYLIEEVLEEPISTNNQLGTLTNFVNLLDLCGVSIPAGTTSDGLPFGVSLLAKCGSDDALLDSAAILLGETTKPIARQEGEELIAVCAAHMSDQPLSYQLRELRARYIETTKTSAHYRLFALSDGRRAGITRCLDSTGAIEVEVWAISRQNLGSLITQIPAPLALGRVELTCGTWVSAFVLSGELDPPGIDITQYGGWRNYLKCKARSDSST